MIDPSSSYTHKLICLPDADTQPRGSASRSSANPSSNSVIVVDNNDREIDSNEMSGCLRMARSFSMDDDIFSDIFFETYGAAF